MSANLRDQLQAIRDEHGTLTPRLVVDTAADPEHPLHSRFDWVDSIAADKWRLEQAGALLRVTFKPDPSKPVDLRAFVAVRGENSPQSDYTPLDEVAADPFAAELLKRSMKREADAFRRRWQHHAAYIDVVRALIEGESA